MDADRAARLAALLLLADGRFPAGGHAHSAGVEAAVHDGRVRDLGSLEAYTRGQVRTTGATDAALASATVRVVEGGPTLAAAGAALGRLDLEAHARIASPPLRQASRRLGRQLVRAADRCWPAPVLAVLLDATPADGPHLSVATGVVAAAAGVDDRAVAALVLHHAVATPTQAATKLLGLDPYEVAALAARLAPLVAEVGSAAVAAARPAVAAGALDALPAFGGPVVDLASLDHHALDARLFAT